MSMWVYFLYIYKCITCSQSVCSNYEPYWHLLYIYWLFSINGPKIFHPSFWNVRLYHFAYESGLQMWEMSRGAVRREGSEFSCRFSRMLSCMLETPSVLQFSYNLFVFQRKCFVELNHIVGSSSVFLFFNFFAFTTLVYLFLRIQLQTYKIVYWTSRLGKV